LALALLYSCSDNNDKKKEPLSADHPKSSQSAIDSVFNFQYQTDFTDKNIINRSDRKVDLLFNGIQNYFGGQQISIVRFRTECMDCLPIQEYRGGLLFGKRLLITPDKI
jgi:hypothetical protein